MAGYINIEPLQNKLAWGNPNPMLATFQQQGQQIANQTGQVPYMEVDPNQNTRQPITPDQVPTQPTQQKKRYTRGFNPQYMQASNTLFAGLGMLGAKNKNSYGSALKRFNNDKSEYENLNSDLYSTNQDYYGKYQQGGDLKSLYETMSMDPESFRDELTYLQPDYDKLQRQQEMEQYQSLEDYIDNKFNNLPKQKEVVDYQSYNPYDNTNNPYIGNEINTSPYTDDVRKTGYLPTYAPPLNIGFNVRPTPLPSNKEQMSIIKNTALKYNVPPEILAGVYGAETAYGRHKTMVSSAGAQGPFQFMPATARQYGINPWDFNQASDAAAKYLSNSYRKTGNWEDAIASYNAGLGNVKRWRQISETASYVPKVMANAQSLQGKFQKGGYTNNLDWEII